MRLQEAAALDGVTFEDALEAFRTVAEIVVREHFNRNGYTFAVPNIEIAKGGRKFAKLLRTETHSETGKKGQTSVHSFVDKATGEIFKPAGFKAPAKHARGNIYSDDHGAHSMEPAGHIKYLR